ncbi:hypothetical protein FGO68_gene3693 [Halteria grandinella]|uniref:Uncharacterized protein n=1 Tax=Halteria grandinella TaxID=5974 RepID=A0A8J8NCE4_HALGN|nr:hypothetical protein FGO68_gene3693 [Halteria grandinella]
MSGTKGFTFLLPPEIKLYDLTQIMYRKYLQESLPGMINHLQLYTYYLTDKSQTAIIRILGLKEQIGPVMQEVVSKNLYLCVHPVSGEEYQLMKNENQGLLFCIPVDQYGNAFTYPFFMPILRGTPLDEVRQMLIEKVGKYQISYHYSKDEWRVIEFEQIQTMVLNYAEFKSSRRQIDYSKVILRDFGKHETYIEFPKGQVFVNIGIEFQLNYQSDENQRNNGQLKINAA